MTTRKQKEARKDYLLRVAVALIRENWEAAECTTEYDGTTCDGNCLADDIEAELERDGNSIEAEPEEFATKESP